MRAGFDPALHTPLSWTVVRHGIRWMRVFHTEDAAWRAVCGACYSSTLYAREKWEMKKAQRKADGYSVKPVSWIVKKETE